MQLKRGGERNHEPLHDDVTSAAPSPHEILIVDDLLDQFAIEHPTEAELVKLRYFAGFNTIEAAKILGIPSTIAHRHWNCAKTWIYRQMKRGE